MCAINTHPVSTVLVLIAPDQGAQGCLRPGACLTPLRAKIHHLTIVGTVVHQQGENANKYHSLHSDASTSRLTTLANIRVLNMLH